MEERPLTDAINALTDIQRKLSSLSARDDEERRWELVTLRRALSEQMLVVSKAADGDAALNADPDLAREFRTRFSAMRSTIAVHQASWPAVSLDRDDPQYRASTANVGKLNREFAEWVQAHMLGGKA